MQCWRCGSLARRSATFRGAGNDPPAAGGSSRRTIPFASSSQNAEQHTNLQQRLLRLRPKVLRGPVGGAEMLALEPAHPSPAAGRTCRSVQVDRVMTSIALIAHIDPGFNRVIVWPNCSGSQGPERKSSARVLTMPKFSEADGGFSARALELRLDSLRRGLQLDWRLAAGDAPRHRWRGLPPVPLNSVPSSVRALAIPYRVGAPNAAVPFGRFVIGNLGLA